MRLPWKRRRRHVRRSPFDAEVIRPGDPGWAIFEETMRTGRPVVGLYDSETGEVVSMRVVPEWDDAQGGDDD